MQRQHWGRNSRLDRDKCGARCKSQETTGNHNRLSQPNRTSLDHRSNERGERNNGESLASKIERSIFSLVSLVRRYTKQRQSESERADREVNKKNAAPSHPRQRKTPDHRPGGDRRATGRCPNTDRSGAKAPIL